MLAFAPWQALLNGLGWILAGIYNLIPDYGIAIILLTLLIRAVLLPLYTRQIKSMQNMQALQPELQKIKTKYKGNSQKQQEEQMRLYREAGVSPFSSCLPLLLQFPFLIAMFSVLRTPLYQPVQEQDQVVAYEIINNHLPVDSELFASTVTHSDRHFLGMNLDCTPRQAWQGPPTQIVDTDGNPAQAGLPLEIGGTPVDGFESQATLDCGTSRSAAIPYGIALIIMTGAQIFTTWQSQRVSPPGAQTGSQQAIMRVMPLLFLFFGINFVAALILYWSTSSLVQVAQQSVLIRLGHIGPDALERRKDEQRQRQQQAAAEPPKQGWMQRMLARAENTATQREQAREQAKNAKGSKGSKGSKDGSRATGNTKSGSPGGGSTRSSSSQPPKKTRRPGSTQPGNQLKRKPDGSSGAGS
jgi:YidC/Oxa1 family membrane protein insertase